MGSRLVPSATSKGRECQSNHCRASANSSVTRPPLLLLADVDLLGISLSTPLVFNRCTHMPRPHLLSPRADPPILPLVDRDEPPHLPVDPLPALEPTPDPTCLATHSLLPPSLRHQLLPQSPVSNHPHSAVNDLSLTTRLSVRWNSIMTNPMFHHMLLVEGLRYLPNHLYPPINDLWPHLPDSVRP